LGKGFCGKGFCGKGFCGKGFCGKGFCGGGFIGYASCGFMYKMSASRRCCFTLAVISPVSIQEIHK
jgi:hypothetical protein